jgi:Tfp pilus assembly protein PilN
MPNIQAILMGVLALIMLGLCVTIGIQHATITNQRANIAALTAENSACVASNDTWKKLTDTQNAAIAKLKTVAQQRAATAAKAQQTASLVSAKDKAKAQAILAQAVDADDCKGAMQVLKTYLNGGRQ